MEINPDDAKFINNDWLTSDDVEKRCRDITYIGRVRTTYDKHEYSLTIIDIPPLTHVPPSSVSPICLIHQIYH